MAKSTRTFKKIGQNKTAKGVAIGFAFTSEASTAELIKLIEKLQETVGELGNISGLVVNGIYSDYKTVDISDPHVDPTNEIIPRTMFDGSTDTPDEQPDYSASTVPPANFSVEESNF